MAIYTVRHDYIDMIGKIWMPVTVCAMRKDLSAYDVENIGELTRENVAHWLILNSGDFQGVDDFFVSIGDWESDWDSEESAFTFHDCMYPSED